MIIDCVLCDILSPIGRHGLAFRNRNVLSSTLLLVYVAMLKSSAVLDDIFFITGFSFCDAWSWSLLLGVGL